jgi:glycosyltransferase involved in cell wall biosynthesis
MRLLCVLAEFPSLSETFVLREMSGLADMGFDVRVYAQARGATEGMHPEAAPFLETAIFRPAPRDLSLHRSWLATAARQPLRSAIVGLPHAARALTFRWAPWQMATAIWSAAYLARRLDEMAVDHIHAHFASYPAAVALLASRFTGIPFSFSAHANDIFADISPYWRLQTRAARFVTVCSQAGLTRARELCRAEDAEKLHLVYHGVDLERFSAPARGPAPDGPVRLLSAGRLVPKKGFEVLLRACHLLALRDRDFSLTIIGDGPLRGELHGLTRRLRLTDRVAFGGTRPIDAMPAAYRNADLVALASVVTADGDRDGIPNVALEAMACGLPVVSCDVGGIAEAVADGETGLIAGTGDPADFADKLDRLIVDAGLRRRLGESARRLVQRRFDAAQGLERLARLFRAAATGLPNDRASC